MDLDPIIRTGIKAAYKAGRILNEHFGKITRIDKKGVIDLVTEADTASETAIIQTIKKDFPQHTILAEESGLHQGTEGECWIVDPLDGTTNFAHQLGIYCISIAFTLDHQLMAGIVLNPADGELFSAAKGRGAMLNNLPIHVSTNTDLQDCLLATGFPYDVRKKTRPLLSRLKQFLISSQGIRRLGSAALDLCYVASGRFDGFWEQGLKPWDMAAGALIVQEAGGRTTGFADQPFDLNRNEILATNGLIHMQMLTLLDQEEQEEDI